MIDIKREEGLFREEWPFFYVSSIQTAGHLLKELRELQTDFTLTVRPSEIQDSTE
jgi:hypothetical protein